MSESSQERNFKPLKGPPLSPTRLKTLNNLYDSLDQIPEGDGLRGFYQMTIDFILRRDCLCPDESQHCRCGGGFGYIGGGIKL